jgi:hypothetical protein
MVEIPEAVPKTLYFQQELLTTFNKNKAFHLLWCPVPSLRARMRYRARMPEPLYIGAPRTFKMQAVHPYISGFSLSSFMKSSIVLSIGY